MSREPTQPLDRKTQEVIRSRLDDMGISRAELARRSGVDRALITRILDPAHKQKAVSTRALGSIARALGLPNEIVVQQYEFELDITEDFIEAARSALTEELLRLRENIGRMRATRVSAVVGLEIHGLSPEKQVFERVFSISSRPASPSRL